jgi:uncharacterized protein DUF4258
VSDTLERVRRLVAERYVRLSDHAFERLLRHDIEYEEILLGVDDAIVVEDYPDYVHGPSVLALQNDTAARPLHVLWGLPKETLDIAVIVTAYRPDHRWDRSYLKRLQT